MSFLNFGLWIFSVLLKRKLLDSSCNAVRFRIFSQKTKRVYDLSLSPFCILILRTERLKATQ